MVMKALVIDGSPEPSSPTLVAWLAEDRDFIVAVDHGAVVCHAAGIVPNLFVGDEDSIDPLTRAWVHENAGSIVKLEVEKDATDLGVALACVEEEAERRGDVVDLTLTCATGGRPDHALAVIGLLAQYRKMVPDLVEDDYDMCILSPEGLDSWEFTGEIGKTFSAIALEPGTSISIDGMRWNLDGFDLPLLSDRGVSNIILEDGAKVWCEEGCLAAFLIK